jgi:hypothetical protein
MDKGCTYIRYGLDEASEIDKIEKWFNGSLNTF